MSKLVVRFAIVFSIVYPITYAVAAFFNSKVTPQKINDQEVDPKILKWLLILNGCDSDMIDFWLFMYKNGLLKVDENGMLA